MFRVSRIFNHRIIIVTALVLFCSAVRVMAQSTDVRFPTGVAGNEIKGAIQARDIGDSRLTDHFYTFNGLPGDLLITVESNNLNGDFDVFTAAELRPVMKVTVYAGTSTMVTKNIYLRRPESLILRVEARSPNDDEGSYWIRFTGSFEPVSNASAAESAKPSKPSEEGRSPGAKSSDRKTTRVSSVGARIEEPVEEIAAKPTPEPTPAAAAEETATTSAKKTTAPRPSPRRPRARATPPKETAKVITPDTDKSSISSNKKQDTEAANTSPATANTKSRTGTKPVAPATDAKKGAEKPLAEEDDNAKSTASEAKSNPPTNRRTASRPARKPPAEESAEPPSENSQRLLIEVRDGTRIEYLMSNVKRVTVENGVVVILSKQGNMQRVPMATIVRMSIGP